MSHNSTREYFFAGGVVDIIAMWVGLRSQIKETKWLCPISSCDSDSRWSRIFKSELACVSSIVGHMVVQIHSC